MDSTFTIFTCILVVKGNSLKPRGNNEACNVRVVLKRTVIGDGD